MKGDYRIIACKHISEQVQNSLSQIIGNLRRRVILRAVHEEEAWSVALLVHDRLFLVLVVTVGSLLRTRFRLKGSFIPL